MILCQTIQLVSQPFVPSAVMSTKTTKACRTLSSTLWKMCASSTRLRLAALFRYFSIVRTLDGGKICVALSATALKMLLFFIPMITARYFQSERSRDEILSFYGKCRTLGVTELILPIVLAGRSQIRDDSDDEVIRIIARVRYMDWTEIWQSGRGSPAWNIGVTRLVQRLVSLQERVEGHLAHALIDPEVTQESEDEAQKSIEPWAVGHIDRAEVDGRFVLDEVNQVIDELRALLADLGSEFDRVGMSDPQGIRGALDRIGARYAARGHDVVKQARTALDDLIEYDAKVRALIRASRAVAAKGQPAPLSKQVGEMRESALRLGDSIRVVDAMSEVLRRYSDVSVGLRVALSPARAGLQTVRDIAHILDGWVSLEA